MLSLCKFASRTRHKTNAQQYTPGLINVIAMNTNTSPNTLCNENILLLTKKKHARERPPMRSSSRAPMKGHETPRAVQCRGSDKKGVFVMRRRHKGENGWPRHRILETCPVTRAVRSGAPEETEANP